MPRAAGARRGSPTPPGSDSHHSGPAETPANGMTVFGGTDAVMRAPATTRLTMVVSPLVAKADAPLLAAEFVLSIPDFVVHPRVAMDAQQARSAMKRARAGNPHDAAGTPQFP